MKTPEYVYGVYNLNSLGWVFFTQRLEALQYMDQKEPSSFGPIRFPLLKALEQFNRDLSTSGDSALTPDKFLQYLQRTE
jgi:hypothetical protein